MPALSKVVQPVPETCSAELSAGEALQQLLATGADALLVEKQGTIVGLFGHREAVAAFDDGSRPVERYMRRPLPGRNVADSLESGADIMYREDTPLVLITEDEGPLFKKTSKTIGIVSALEVLAEIGKTTTDTASNKVFLGRRDLGLNVPVSPCQRACPIHQDIATYVDYVSQGRYLDSWLVIHETNPFPSMLGRLCNHPCETDCKRGWVQGPENAVSIKSLKRFATDYAWARRVKIDWQRAPENGKRVAIVGSGPAGMTAAQDLRLMGYTVDLYEREAKLGGLLSASIPHFRFDIDQLEWEMQMIVDMGVNVFLNKNVGKDIKLEQLFKEYDAVFLSVGMMTGRILPVPGSDLPEVISAMEFLRVRSYDIMPENFPRGGDVVVIGGGAVATDAAQTSIKSGARKVWMVSIEPADRLPAFGNELVEAREIGLTLHTGVIVNAIKADGAGHVSGVEFIRVDESKLEFDPESGKLLINTVQKLPGTEHVIPCRYAIFASGQIMDFAQDQGVPLTPRKLMEADTGGHTKLDKLFAGGDCVEGPSFIVNAIAWGHRTARSINEYLGAAIPRDAKPITVIETTDDHREADYYNREEPPILPADKRMDMTPVELPWNDEQAITAALRCFQCDTVHHVDESTCILCGACDDVCPEKALDVVVYGENRDTSSGGFVEICNTVLGEEFGGKAGKILVNYDRCTNCRICEDHCPVNCITFQRVRFRDDAMQMIPLTPVASRDRMPANAV
ncbi:MAG: 4Fe-4S dicluster domain-containing protein [Chloroflexi bacterium]|nr:MAG: 4Fe-4S dicluster domain-containing protein [Chloroflexota bacterium]